MMPKSLLRARRLTALLAVSMLTVTACSEDGGIPGGSTVEVVQIVTVPNGQTLTNLIPAATRQFLGVPTNGEDQFIDKPVTFASTNNAVFTVSATGLVTAVAGGNAYLRATAGGKTDSVLIGVRFPVQTVTIAPAVVTLRREQTQQLTVTTLDTQGATVTGRTITWISDTPANVTVSATGLAAAQPAAADASTAIITATANNAADGVANVSGTRTITVNGDATVASVTITGLNAAGFYGTAAADLALTATALSGLGNPIPSAVIAWTSSTGATATVSGAGLVDFVATGTTNIRATTETFTGSGVNVFLQRAIQVAPTLVNGVAQVGAMAAGTGTDFAFSADAVGAASFAVNTAGGSGDGDLYVIAPGSTNWTTTDAGGSNFVCRSWNSGNGETCNIGTPVAGWYRIRLYSWTPAGAVAGMNITLTHP